MFDAGLLRRLGEESGGLFAVGTDGEAIPLEGLDHPTSPGLVVGPVSEAVKEVVEGRLIRYQNRDTLWVVEGFVLHPDLVASLAEAPGGPEELIARVTEAGHNWVAVPRIDQDSV